ncbi:MAG: homoserine O-succinyltransferase [Lachnospiraceae bacterium]|nr:homoserine O-succinyltransferase [Lachnospiraceae bacterium]
MPIKIQSDLPAKEQLEKENIFVMDENRALHQDVRPIEIGILNLMPVKEDTELQLLRALSNTPLQVDVNFLTLTTHVSKNTSLAHLNKFYSTVPELIASGIKLDGLIITGAPLEQLDYEKVDFWDELKSIFDWADTNVTSTLCVCWGALAGLYHYYGIPKYSLDEKLSGIYPNKILDRKVELVRGCDDVIFAPHSRFSVISHEDIDKVPNLKVLAESKEAGIFLVIDESCGKIFMMGHPEYDRMTLDEEYHRDLNRGLHPIIPKNYYPDNDPTERPTLTWRSTATLLYTNWLNYYVYQTTPYEWNQ